MILIWSNILNSRIQSLLMMYLKESNQPIMIKWPTYLNRFQFPTILKILSLKLHNNCKVNNHRVYCIKIIMPLAFINNKIMVISNIIIKAIFKIKAAKYIQIKWTLSMVINKKDLLIYHKADNSLDILLKKHNIDFKILIKKRMKFHTIPHTCPGKKKTLMTYWYF